jgi:hypothetical protein
MSRETEYYEQSGTMSCSDVGDRPSFSDVDDKQGFSDADDKPGFSDVGDKPSFDDEDGADKTDKAGA